MGTKPAANDEQIIAALLQHRTIQAAADAIGISPRTIYTRMREREFRSTYLWARTEILREAVFSVNSALTDALDTISAIMADSDTPPAVRLQAAQFIITSAEKFSDRLDAAECRARNEAKTTTDVWAEM